MFRKECCEFGAFAIPCERSDASRSPDHLLDEVLVWGENGQYNAATDGAVRASSRPIRG
jgi:hypothetical protein